MHSSFLKTAQVFLVGLKLDLSILGYLLVLTLVLGLFQPKIISKISTVTFALLLFFHSLITTIDIGLYKVWGHTINFQFFEYIKQPKEAMASAGTSGLLVPILMLIFGAFCAYYLGYRKHPQFIEPTKGIVARLWQFLIVLPLAVLAARGGLQLSPVNQSFAFYSTNNTLNYAAINGTWNFIFTMIEKQENLDLSKFEVVNPDQLQTQFDTYFPSRGHFPKFTNVDKPNVVLVILESFSANLVGFCNEGKGVTPNLDAIAKEGISFSNAYSSGNRTDKGLAAILSGFPAQANTSIITIPDKAQQLPSLTKQFLGKGYNATFYYGGEPEFANMKAYFLSTGFERIVSVNDFDESIKRGKWGVADEYFFDRLLKEMKETKQPYFKAGLTLSSHEPFDLPKKGKEQESDPFTNAMHYTDQCLGKFWEQVKTLPSFKNTLFVFVADHGRQIGDETKDYYPVISRLPIVFAGGALVDSVVGKHYTNKVHQHHLPSNLLAGLGWENAQKQFLFQSTFSDTLSPIYYTYFDGVGLFNKTSCMCFDNKPFRSNKVYGTWDDSLAWQAQLYQQAVMSYFLAPSKKSSP